MAQLAQAALTRSLAVEGRKLKDPCQSEMLLAASNRIQKKKINDVRKEVNGEKQK